MSSIPIPVINRRDILLHATWWCIYLIFIILVNLSINSAVSIAGIVVMTLILAAAVYTIILAGQPFVHGRSTSRLIAVATTSFLVLMGAVYLLVYRILPAADIFLYIEGKDFHFGKFAGFCIKNYGMVVLVAIAYLITQKNRIAAKREVELERTKRMMAEEIMQWELTVLSQQLNSHWMHSIHQLIAEKVADDPRIAVVHENLQQLLVYYFEHLDKPGPMNTTLEDEMGYLHIMAALNKVLHPSATPVQISTNPHPVARTIPRLLLSTLLENMFLYADQYDPAIPATMTISSMPDQLTVRCRNKTDPGKRTAGSTGVGHKNIRRQLDATGRKYSFGIRDENQVYEVTLTIYYE